MVEESIIFSPDIDDRELDREVRDVDRQLDDAGHITPELGDVDTGGLFGGGGGGLGGGSRMMGGMAEGIDALGPMADYRNRLLEDILDEIEAGMGGDGGFDIPGLSSLRNLLSGGLGGLIGGGIGITIGMIIGSGLPATIKDVIGDTLPAGIGDILGSELPVPKSALIAAGLPLGLASLVGSNLPVVIGDIVGDDLPAELADVVGDGISAGADTVLDALIANGVALTASQVLDHVIGDGSREPSGESSGESSGSGQGNIIDQIIGGSQDIGEDIFGAVAANPLLNLGAQGIDFAAENPKTTAAGLGIGAAALSPMPGDEVLAAMLASRMGVSVGATGLGIFAASQGASARGRNRTARNRSGMSPTGGQRPPPRDGPRANVNTTTEVRIDPSNMNELQRQIERKMDQRKQEILNQIERMFSSGASNGS